MSNFGLTHLNSNTVIIRLSLGAYSKVDLQERGLIREGGLIQKSGKYVAKEPKKCFEVLKTNWIKWLLS